MTYWYFRHAINIQLIKKLCNDHELGNWDQNSDKLRNRY
jgi:hypothetical protein